MFDFRRITPFCLGYRLSKHKMTICSNHLGEHGPVGPPGYAYVWGFIGKMCTCSLYNAASRATYGCSLWCSEIVYIRPYSLDNITTFHFVTECQDVTVLVWGHVQATTHSYFTWPWPGLDSNSHHAIFVSCSGCSVVSRPVALGDIQRKFSPNFIVPWKIFFNM